MEQTVLTPLQQRIITLVKQEENLQSFYLSGGTALAAYYLQHRLSDDLDFFTPQKPDVTFLLAFMEKLSHTLQASQPNFQRLYDRNLFLLTVGTEEIKLEFTYYPFPQFQQPTRHDGLAIDSLRDLAANKLMALLDRLDPKDFVDLFFLLDHFDLVTIRQDAEKKFDTHIDTMFLGSSLARVKQIAALPKMLKPLAIEDLKLFFANKAKQLGPSILEG